MNGRARLRKGWFKPFNIKYLWPFLFFMGLGYIVGGIWQIVNQQATIPDGIPILLIHLIIGIIMMSMRLVRLWHWLYFLFYGRYMRKNGIILNTKVIAVVKNDNIGINGICRHYFISEYEDPSTHQTYQFKSRLYRKVLTRSIKEGKKVNVYIIPSNYEKYYIDDSFLYKKR